MPNRNYEKGRRKEYKIRRNFERDGWIVLRTAGSHGFADLIAIKGKHTKFIQCKPDNFSEAKTKRLMEKYWWLNKEEHDWEVSFEVI